VPELVTHVGRLDEQIPLVVRAVVVPAEEHQVRELVFASVLLVFDVVHVQEVAIDAARDHAATTIAEIDLTA
jgi:hypothetical protein